MVASTAIVIAASSAIVAPAIVTVKSCRKANYTGSADVLVETYKNLLRYEFGYALACEDPIDEPAFAQRKQWVHRTCDCVQSHLLVRYSTFFELGILLCRSGLIAVSTKSSRHKPTGREVKQKACEFASEMRALLFHVPLQYRCMGALYFSANP